MAGEIADLAFTDPPYNVDYEGYTEQKLKIKGDRMSDADFKQFLEAAFRGLRTAVKPGASLYVCHSSSWSGSFRMRWSRLPLRFGVRASGQKTRSRGASAGTNSDTSHFSTVMSPARRTLGTGTKHNRRFGKKRNRQRTGFIRPQSPLN